jgi:hypothetical protein
MIKDLRQIIVAHCIVADAEPQCSGHEHDFHPVSTVLKHSAMNTLSPAH